MSDTNRVHAGIPTGGQFTAITKTEADVALAEEQMNTAGSNAATAEREYLATTATYIGTALLAEYPDAYEVALEESDQEGCSWDGVSLLDRDGNEIADYEAFDDLTSEFWELPENQPSYGEAYPWIRFIEPEGRRGGSRSAVFNVIAAVGE